MHHLLQLSALLFSSTRIASLFFRSRMLRREISFGSCWSFSRWSEIVPAPERKNAKCDILCPCFLIFSCFYSFQKSRVHVDLRSISAHCIYVARILRYFPPFSSMTFVDSLRCFRLRLLDQLIFLPASLACSLYRSLSSSSASLGSMRDLFLDSWWSFVVTKVLQRPDPRDTSVTCSFWIPWFTLERYFYSFFLILYKYRRF